MVANNLCKIIYINILNYNIYFKDKLILDVAEAPKPGQLKELGEASDDELVEVQEPALEVLEQCEFEEEDVGLEEIDQDKLEVSGDCVHRPDAPREDQYICQRLGRRLIPPS